MRHCSETVRHYRGDADVMLSNMITKLEALNTSLERRLATRDIMLQEADATIRSQAVEIEDLRRNQIGSSLPGNLVVITGPQAMTTRFGSSLPGKMEVDLQAKLASSEE